MEQGQPQSTHSVSVCYLYYFIQVITGHQKEDGEKIRKPQFNLAHWNWVSDTNWQLLFYHPQVEKEEGTFMQCVDTEKV